MNTAIENQTHPLLKISEILLGKDELKLVLQEAIAHFCTHTHFKQLAILKLKNDKASITCLNGPIFDSVVSDKLILEVALETKNNGQIQLATIQSKSIRSWIDKNNIIQLIGLPILVNEQYWGTMLGISLNTDLEWKDADTAIFTSFTNAITRFIELREHCINQDEQIVAKTKEVEFYDRLLNNIPADIVVFDLEQKYRFINKNSIKNDEVRKWLIGKDDFDFCRERGKDMKIAQLRRERYNQMLTEKKAYEFEERFDLPDGKFIAHLRKMHPIFDEDGNIINSIGYGVDITQMVIKDEIIKKQNETISYSPDGIALLNSDGTYYYMNNAHEELFEYDKGELIGKHWRTLYDEEEADRIDKVIFPELNKNGHYTAETSGKTKHGKTIYQEITLRFLPDGTLVCITRDISSLKQSLTLIEQVNQKLELAINAANLGMWEWNIEGDMLVGNENFNTILGYAPGYNLTGDLWLESIHADDKAKVNYELEKIKKSSAHFKNNGFNYEYRIKTSAGNYIWVLDIGKVLEYDELGNPKDVIGLILNITQNKLYEEQILKSEKRYRDLVENLREVIFETDKKGNIVFLNPAWSQLTGYTVEESIGKPLLDYVHPEFIKESKIDLKGFVNNNDFDYLQKEMAFLHKVGFEVWFDIELRKAIDEDNKVITLVGSIENITTRKLAEEELKNALEKEKQLGDLKSRFVSMASHEFRTPLSGIRSSAELMQIYADRDQGLNTLMRKHGIDKKVENIIFDVDRITLLMTDILTMGKIESAKINLNPMELNMVDFVESYVKNEAVRYLNEHHIKVHNIQEVIKVNFDPKLITHVFNNLINNAAKYSSPGSEIDIQITKQSDHVKLIFTDHGIGIPKSELPFMFDSFYRGSNVEMIPGTGLGLPIAKYFMEMHGGKIEITSKQGVGTKVLLELPL